MSLKQRVIELRSQKFGSSREAIKEFNQWLSNRYGVHDVEFLFDDMAQRVIRDLEAMLPVNSEEPKDVTPPLWRPIIKLLVSVYLRGMSDYRDGVRYSTVEEVIEIVKEEINCV